MKHKQKLLVVLLVAILTLGVAGIASADQVSGQGKLEAWGDGLAGIRGEGVVDVSGNGVLYFKDVNGDATWSIEGDGFRVGMQNGWIAWVGFDGTFHAEGTRIAVALHGTDIVLTAEGIGWALLRGEGHYIINGEDGEWTGEVQRLDPSNQ